MLVCESPAATAAAGEALAGVVNDPLVVALIGGLGAGKTSFSQGVGEGLQVLSDVLSPTFSLVAEHEGRLPLLHADVYRLEPGEIDGIGLEEQLEGWEGVALVEWADRFEDLLPADHLEVRLTIDGPERRTLQVRAFGPSAGAASERWRAAVGGRRDGTE